MQCLRILIGNGTLITAREEKNYLKARKRSIAIINCNNFMIRPRRWCFDFKSPKKKRFTRSKQFLRAHLTHITRSSRPVPTPTHRYSLIEWMCHNVAWKCVSFSRKQRAHKWAKKKRAKLYRVDEAIWHTSRLREAVAGERLRTEICSVTSPLT
jgi:hypothetical protein